DEGHTLERAENFMRNLARLVASAEPRQSACLLEPEEPELVSFTGLFDQGPAALEELERAGRVAPLDLDVREQMVSAREVVAVLAELEQRDRAIRGTGGELPCTLGGVQARLRPGHPSQRFGIACPVASFDDLCQQLLGAAEISTVDEDVRERNRVPLLARRIRDPAGELDHPLVDSNRARELAAQGECATERDPRRGMLDGGIPEQVERFLELLDRSLDQAFAERDLTEAG